MVPGSPEPDARRPEAAGAARASGASTAGVSPPTQSLIEVPSDFFPGAGRNVSPLIDGYDVLREIHHGGQGVVYEALQKSTNRKVALKMLLDDHSGSESARRRFEREVKLVAQLRHPNIIAIHDSGVTPDGRCYFVMDYVRGAPLRQFVHERRLTLEHTLELFRQVCAAVEHAHARGVIHRDLKPSNILVGDDGVPVVLDFGLAKSAAATTETLVSQTGQLIGTWPYMSPEQTRAKPDNIDARSDVYALGVVLYEVLTGRYPYTVVGALEDVLKNIREAPPSLPSRSWDPVAGVAPRGEGSGGELRCPLDKDLDTIVLKALAKEPERRYASAAGLGGDLERYGRGEPIEARRDSVTYVLRKRGRALAGRHRITAFAAVVVFTAAAAILIGEPILRWTSVSSRFLELVMRTFAFPIGPTFDHVRVIGLTERTDVEGLALREGLERVNYQNITSLRRLHGRLMEALATSGCRAVVWDITFARESEFDEDFLKGVRALDKAGIDVVVGVEKWWLDPQSKAAVSANLAPEVKWGCVGVRFVPNMVPAVQLVARRGWAVPQASLSLAAFSAYRHPDHDYDIILDPRCQHLDVRYWPRENNPQARRFFIALDRVKLTAGAGGPADTGDFAGAIAENLGLQLGDVVGLYVVGIPPDPVLNASTLEYGEILTMDPVRLEDRLKGKVVVLANLRDSKDRRKIPGGREVSGGYAHATAIDALIGNEGLRMQVALGEALIPLSGALLGALAARLTWHRPLHRYLLSLVLAALFMLASLISYRFTRYLFNPVLPVLALWMSCELGAVLSRMFQGGAISSLERRSTL